MKRLLCIPILWAIFTEAIHEAVYGKNLVIETYSVKKEPSVQIPIDVKNRIVNSSGNCVWCSVETIGRHQRIKKLVGICSMPQCQGAATMPQLYAFLDKLKVKYRVGTEKAPQTAERFFVRYLEAGYPVAFKVSHCHMLICVHYDVKKKEVIVLDNSEPARRLQKWDWDKFHERWDGWCMIIME